MIIKQGSVNQTVLKWQQFLISKKYEIGSLDGIFGAKTEKATKDWQKKNKLVADGIVGNASFSKAKSQGFAHTVKSLWYPPRPNFGSPPSAKRKQMFGSFEYRRKKGSEIQILGDWVKKNIVSVTIPQLKGLEGAPKSGRVRFHKNGAKQLKGLFNEIENQGLDKLLVSWAGSFYPRFVRGSTRSLSNHSWGTAFDINAPQNWLGQKPAAVGKKGSLLKIVPIANSYGFYWGGHYRHRFDGMHFELAVLDKYP